jgi:dTDP-glucose pyrophosphorylase
MTIKLIVLSGGHGTRFHGKTNSPGKPLIKVLERPQLFWAILGGVLSYSPDSIILAVRSGMKTAIEEEISVYDFGKPLSIVDIGPNTSGAAESAYNALTTISRDQKSSNFIIADNDCFNLVATEEKLEHQFPFVSVVESRHPQHSYVHLTSNGKVKNIFEKIVISRFAVSGHYGFSSFEEYFKAYSSTKFEGSEKYLSAVANTLATIEPINPLFVQDYVSFGTPEEISSLSDENYVTLKRNLAVDLK